MDFTKFTSMLDCNGLYFARADLLGDPFESTVPKGTFNAMRASHEAQLAEIARRAGEEVNHEGDKWEAELLARSEVSHAYMMSKTTFVNCWHANHYESAAMWRLYLKSDEGFAVQSTASRLVDSLKDYDRDVNIGKVSYVDYDNDFVSARHTVDYAFYKRVSYSHEQEVRAVVWLPEYLRMLEATEIGKTLPTFKTSPPNGIVVPAQLSTLLERVYIAPSSPEWIHKLVKAILSKYNLEIETVHSSLADSPLR